MSSSPTPYPAAVGEWITGSRPQRVLDLATGRAALALQLAGAGSEVTCLDRNPGTMIDLTARLFREGQVTTERAAVPSERLVCVVGQAENLPFGDTHFDLVTVAEHLHQLAPGLALAEAARVLRPGGSIAVVYNTRDDTVPWVKRLARLAQQFDPSIMRGDYDHGAVDALSDSPYFSEPVRKHFRNWIPVTRPAMLAMVARNPVVAGLPESQREELMLGVGEVYDSSARAPEPLLLPFQASAWKAVVDHREVQFTGVTDDGLDIRLQL